MRIPLSNTRTVISASTPQRYEGDYCSIFLWVWFEELDEPVSFIASPFDVERHGKALWIRAMAGEYGPIEVLPLNPEPKALPQPMRMLTHDR